MNLDTFIATVVERRWLTILLSILAMVILTVGAGRIAAVDVDVRNHFDPGEPEMVALKNLEETYALSDVFLVAIAPREGTIFNKESLTAIESMADEMWSVPYVTRVDSITNYSHSEGYEDELIVEQLVEDIDLLTEEDLARIEDIAINTEEVSGRFVSKDGRVAVLLVSAILPDDTRQSAKREVTDFLHATLADVRAANPSLEYHITGEMILNRALGDALNDEMEVLAPIALGLMVLLALVLLRSITATITIILVLTAVIASSLGFVGWTGMTLFGESMGAFFVLMAVTLAHCVHIVEGVASGMRQGMERRPAISYSLKLNVWPVFLTSATTSIGFLSLNFAEMLPFHVLGNIVAFGAMAAFVFAVTLLPAILSVVPMRVPPQKKLNIFDAFARFVISNRMVVLWTFGIGIAIAIAGISRIELKENWLELLDDSYEFRQSVDFMSQNFSTVETYEYSLDSGEENGVTNVEFLNKVEHFAEWFRTQPEVVHVFSVADVMKRLNKNLNSDNPDFYVIPENSELAAQYLLLFEFSLPVGRDLNNLIDYDRAKTRVTVALRSLTSKEKIDLDDRAVAWLVDNYPELETAATGVQIVGARSIQRNIEGMLLGTGIAMLIVTILLFFVFRNIRLGFISLIPNFFPAAITIGLWGYIVGEVNVAASVVTAIAFGIVVDDTIHFMTKYVDARKRGLLPSEAVQSTFRTVGKALVTTTIVFGLGFMVFGASSIETNHALGILVGITVVVALLADFFFLPPLLLVLDETKETTQQIRERLQAEKAEREAERAEAT